MPTIQISKSLVEELKIFLQQNNLYRPNMRVCTMVETALALLIYETSSLEVGRSRSLEILEKAGIPIVNPTLKGKVSRWAKTVNWDANKPGDTFLPSELQDALKQAILECEAPLSVDDPLLEVPKEDRIPQCPVSDSPPWDGKPRISISQLEEAFPKHCIFDWLDQNPLKTLAAEVAFAAVPMSLRDSAKVLEIAESLFKIFSEWKINQGKQSNYSEPDKED